MQIDLRQAVLLKIKNKSESELKDMVDSSILEQQEKTLPGLGVIFEIIWQNSNEKVKTNLIHSLKEELKNFLPGKK